jgi:serine/threonine-protein kinase
LHVSGVLEFERWLDEEREHVRRRACEAAKLLTDRADTAENAMGAARWAHRLTELSPSDETAVRRLIELLDRAGDRAGAVREYEEFQRRLARDLELEPSAETRALVEAVRARRQPDAAAAVVHREVATAGESAPAARAMSPASSSVSSVPPARVARRRVAVVLALVVGTLLTGGWFLFRAQFDARSAEVARNPKRLVVLPFVNLGAAEDEYFADGITEEIAARLAAIDRLRVIGSTSANRYKGTEKTIPEIGVELGVDYVLEGSVRWQKSTRGPARVRVTPQLVSTADGTHLWAEVYDEPLDEIFRVQSDIAQKVVQALDVTLLEPQRRVVEAVPTRNLQAYDYYLRGNDYRRRGTEERTARASLRMYEKAVELDPGFALAYAMLARAHTRMYLFYYDHSEDRLARAKQAIDRAFELEPGLPEAHHSLATYYWVGFLDYDRALRELAIAGASRPNEYNVFMTRAVIRTRQGKLREALVDYEKAWQLDPAASPAASNYGQGFDLLRDFARAETLYDRAIALGPDWSIPYYLKAWLYLRWDGSTQRARVVLHEARTAGVADEPLVLLTRVLVEVFDGRYEEVIGLLSSGAPEVIADQFRFVPRAQLYAQVYGLMQRHDLERAYYDSARSFVSRKVQERPEDPRLRSALGIAYAGLGRKREAIQQGEKAVELLPISKEAYQGYYRAWDLARIYAMVGEHDAAVERLEHLLAIPGNLTAAWLRIDPTWDPLRGHPRFQRLVDRGK